MRRDLVAMSAFGHKRTFSGVCMMSALPPKADITWERLACPLSAKRGHRITWRHACFALAISSSTKQRRQLGDICPDPARFIARHHLRCRVPAVVLEVRAPLIAKGPEFQIGR